MENHVWSLYYYTSGEIPYKLPHQILPPHLPDEKSWIHAYKHFNFSWKVVFGWALSGCTNGFPNLKLSVNCASFYFFHISMMIWFVFFNDALQKLQKVSKGAKIRNRYNQVPQLTQDTNGKVTNSQLDTTNKPKRSALSQQETAKHI